MVKKLSLSLLVFSILLLIPSVGLAATGTLSVVKKQAWLTPKGKKETKARRGMKINVGDKLRTAKDSYVKILMPDKNTLHVGPSTEMVMKAYDTKTTDGTETSIDVIYGRVRSALDQKYDGKKSKFNVKTEAAVLGVRGTDFLVKHVGDSSTTKSLVFESQVEAQGIKSGGDLIGSQMVKKGEMTTIVKGSVPTPPIKIPAATLKELDALSKGAGVISLVGIGATAAAGVGAGGAGVGAPDLMGKGDDDDKKEDEKKAEEVKPVEKPKDPASDSNKEGIAFAVKAGTLGASAEVSYPITQSFRIKLDVYNTLKFKFDGTDDNEFYETTVDFTGIGLLGQMGSQGSFQFIFGAYFATNRMELDGTPLGNEAIGDTDYNFSSGNTVAGEGEFENSIAPYVGLGWKFSILGLFDLVGDLGVMSIGEIDVEKLEYNGPTTISAADVELERQEIEDDINRFKLFPVVRVGVGFTF